jgi:UDP-N-acetylmuramoyl-L-alanyl-D-glutamate--2,6-diaminopimelate ligase
MTRALEVPFENIKRGLAHVKVAGRMELYHMRNKDVDVIVDYAHNKLSYQTLFDNVRKLYPGRKILLVFGCHGNKAYNRRKDLGELANIYADKIVLTEQDPGTESVTEICRQIQEHIDTDKPVEVITDRGEAIAAACDMAEDGWVMVIAGNGADGYQKRGLTYVELPTDGERVQEYIDRNR